MNDTVIVAVEGHPAPQGSKKHVGHGRMIEVSKRVKPWRAAVAAAVRTGMRGLSPFPGPVAIHLDFVMPRPLSTPKRLPTPPAVKRPDVDKLARAVLDAVTGIAICDDSQAIHLTATKRIAETGEKAGVVIEIVDLTHQTGHDPKTAQRRNQTAKTVTLTKAHT
jgi:crossover junction endodeoxyribonuclease RusA